MSQTVEFKNLKVRRVLPIDEKIVGDKTYRTVKIDCETQELDPKYTQVYRFEAKKEDHIRETAHIFEGVAVNIKAYLRGRDWTNAKGETFPIESKEIASIEIIGGAKSSDGSAGVGSAKPPLAEPELEEKDDLPF